MVAVDEELKPLLKAPRAAEGADGVDPGERLGEVGEDGRARDGVVALELDVRGAVDFLFRVFFSFVCEGGEDEEWTMRGAEKKQGENEEPEREKKKDRKK